MMPGFCLPSVSGFGPRSGLSLCAGSRTETDMAPLKEVVTGGGYAYVTVTYGGVGWPYEARVKSITRRFV
ncbi:hypothetical protein GCM10010170_090840 [Dactylosporangium salmoneum]|uniref:Uncharacterized protein n=1 Tax=Dactylosporangium salmoneum TaxID=53361 RepID=A0ABN3HKC5_9ACTN